jgi:hypothetical protein
MRPKVFNKCAINERPALLLVGRPLGNIYWPTSRRTLRTGHKVEANPNRRSRKPMLELGLVLGAQDDELGRESVFESVSG